MLDSITKKRIDDLRNILVGKIPSPQSQIEQITTGLVYKFMYDMDQEAVEMGGIASFFVNDFEKYSWQHLFDPKLSGIQKVQLYSDAIEHMYTNPTAPQLFREIFKNSFLPFKDPATLNMFLKEINEFHYSHSEKLGDAFEYLLSFMGSQGDAGQFRTPRHIIDFVIEVVNPTKSESVLDPACGTAGFLISSYKHILNQNTNKKLGDKLTASDRKRIGENLVGYDISPDMTRISLVNMYLHQFANPQIHEYDTLSSEDRWNEYYDVILANPPFFSPTGGIQPHSRFGVQSTRAEVLFVDYIMEHLKPEGRAGIIVPEGVIFQNGSAYKTLRKKLLENSLIGVISLPSGVFQPYSGVKTSILILDKKINQKNNNIFFARIANDGFSLGAQRVPIQKNDLPEIAKLIIQNFNNNIFEESEIFKLVSKEKIRDKDYTFQSSNYIDEKSSTSKFDIVKLCDYADLQRGTSITKKDVVDGSIPVIAGGQKPAYFHNLANRQSNSITVSSSGAYAGFVAIHPYPIFASDCFTIISNSEQLNQKYLFHLLKSRQDKIYSLQSGGAQPHVYARDFQDFEIPLPPIEVQDKLVFEFEAFQKIIDGCNLILSNYKPYIDIDPSWELVELEKIISDNYDSKRVPITKSERVSGSTPYYGASGIVDSVDGYLFDESLLLISEDGANLIDRNYPIAFSISGKTWVNNHAHVLKFEDPNVQKYIECYFNQISLEPYITGAAQPKLNQGTLNKIRIPLPPSDEITSIIKRIDEEKSVVNGNKTLLSIYNDKFQNLINKIWQEG